MKRGDATRYWSILVLLVVLHFAVRSHLGNDRVAPDFLLLALLIYTIRARPGASAVAGFVVGLLSDALSPASFGVGALAHTTVGYLASWAKAVFFAENLLVNGGLIFAGTWVRNLIITIVSGKFAGAQLRMELLVWSSLEALTTAAAGVVVLTLFRQWLMVRVEQT